MIRVRLRRFRADPGKYLSRARRRPVRITGGVGDDLVLLSIGEYERLKSFDTRRVYRPADLPDDLRAALEVAKAPAWTARYNHEVEHGLSSESRE